MSIRVLIADDHDLLRAGLTGVLATDPGIEVVGEADSGPACVERAPRCGPT